MTSKPSINHDRADLFTEVERFREWAAPRNQTFYFWECDYANWHELEKAFFEFVASHPYTDWSAEELAAVLYALARNNESRIIAVHLRQHYPQLLIPLTHDAMEQGDLDARWQLAEQLGWLDSDEEEIEHLLLVLVHDDDEYTRRQSLKSLLRIGSPSVEALALDGWNRPDPNQEWARMMALSCLYEIKSLKLEPFLDEAEKGEFPHLRDYAKKVRRGDVERF